VTDEWVVVADCITLSGGVDGEEEIQPRGCASVLAVLLV